MTNGKANILIQNHKAMKRTNRLTLAATALLAALAFTACSDDDNDNTGKKPTMPGGDDDVLVLTFEDDDFKGGAADYWTAHIDETDAPSVADARLEGTTLTIAPVAEGMTTVTLAAESNGVVTELPIAVSVGASTGIGGVEAGNGGATEVARFTVDGKKLDRPQPGVNIVRMSDGTVRKVVIGR